MLCHDPLVLFFSNRRAGLGGFLVNACLSRILKVRKTLLDWRLKGVTGNYEQSDSSPISVQTNLRLMSRDLWNLSSNDSENSNSHMNLLILFGKYPFPGNGTHLLWNKYFGTTFWISVILVRIKAVNYLNYVNYVNYVNRVNYVTKSDHPRLWSREDLFHSITNVAT